MCRVADCRSATGSGRCRSGRTRRHSGHEAHLRRDRGFGAPPDQQSQRCTTMWPSRMCSSPTEPLAPTSWSTKRSWNPTTGSSRSSRRTNSTIRFRRVMAPMCRCSRCVKPTATSQILDQMRSLATAETTTHSHQQPQQPDRRIDGRGDLDRDRPHRSIV